MKVTLIISTYNRPDALKLVFDSILNQSIMPTEILVADDGSGDKTSKLIEEYTAIFNIPVHHIWQEDSGFRVARIRNLAIKEASTDYIISIDGDIVLHQEYIKSHLLFIKKGFFLQGHRVMLNDKMTEKAIANNMSNFSFWDFDIINRKNTIHNFRLAKIFSVASKRQSGLKGGIISFWKSDAIRVNGFNEDFIGWGKEDSEFAIRLLHSGVKRRDLRFCAVTYHLDHANSNKKLDSLNYKRNLKMMKDTIKNKTQICKNGIEKL